MPQLPRKRELDRRLLDSLIQKHGPISRAALHQLTGMRRSSISQITAELLRESRIVEAGLSDNPVGRKQILLERNPGFRSIVAIGFDDQQVHAGLLDLQPRILSSIHEPAFLSEGSEGLLHQLLSITERLLAESGTPIEKLFGIGIADPGLVDTRRGITLSSSTIDFWQNVPVRKHFEERFGVRVLLESTTRVKTIAETVSTAGDPIQNLIYLDYGTGIGASIVLDGRLLYGATCGAGEVGHTNIQRDGPTCKCGSRGCLEAMAGASAVVARIRQHLASGIASPALGSIEPDAITLADVLKAASAGDKLCANVVTEMAEDLGMALANMVNLFNPEVILMDRRLSAAGEEFLLRVKSVIHRQSLAGSSQGLSLRFASLGPESVLLGLGLRILDLDLRRKSAGDVIVHGAEDSGWSDI